MRPPRSRRRASEGSAPPGRGRSASSRRRCPSELVRAGWGLPRGPVYHLVVPETAEVVGIGLAGGRGVRARPLTLKAPGYLRSKAAMSFLGRRLIQWVIQVL